MPQGNDSVSAERALALVDAIDTIRDQLTDDGDPQTMFEALLRLLVAEFRCDAAAIMLLAETSDDVELVVHENMSVATALELTQRSARQQGIHWVANAPWLHTIGIQIVMDGYEMGAVILARQTTAFDAGEVHRMARVENQLDSAVAQARAIWKLTQRNRELEAIYDLDRLRDRVSSPEEFINDMGGLVTRSYDASLCLVIAPQAGGDGDLRAHGWLDKHNLSAAALAELESWAARIAIPQAIPTPEGINDLLLLAAPLVTGTRRLGAVIVGRAKAFTLADHRLLHAIMSQTDSALLHLYTLRQLAQRQRELEVIYRIDRIRDREKDFDAMLGAVLTELQRVIPSQLAFIMLYDQSHEARLELRAFAGQDSGPASDYVDMLQNIGRQALATGTLVAVEEEQGAVRAYMAIPLILNERILGVCGLVKGGRSGAFSREEQALLQAITSQIDTAIFERLEHRRMRTLLSRSVDPKVVERLMQQTDSAILSGERVTLSVLFADLRGSTEWAEHTAPEHVVAALNLYLGRMTDVIFRHGGTLDKFVGDQVIGLFGTPVRDDDHALRAAAAALDMQAEHTRLQAELLTVGRELPSMGIGISSGEAIAGEFGNRVRTEFTAVGRIVNLGARLCGAAGEGEILVSEATYSLIESWAAVDDLGEQHFKGISSTPHVYQLRGLSS